MCVLRNTHVCMPTAAIGRPALEPWVQPSIDFFCNKHMCVCPQQQLACQSVECSEEPSLGFFIGLACNTNVCAHSSSWSTKQQSVCQRVSIGWFCTRHVWSEKHTCVCPQQQLVGQPLTLGCSPELTSSATHMWVLTAAIGLPKLLNVQNLHLTSSLSYSARHMCVFTAAVGPVGRPTLS